MSERRGVSPSPCGEGQGRSVGAGPSERGTGTSSSSSQAGVGQGGALSGHLQGGTHILPIRVYYEDTDFSGFAYHGSYVRFLERGRTELVRSLSISQAELHAEEGFAFVVRKMTLEYLRPARMDDELTVTTEVVELRGASMLLAQSVLRGDEVLVTGEVVVAATKNGRAVRIPDVFRSAMEK